MRITTTGQKKTVSCVAFAATHTERIKINGQCNAQLHLRNYTHYNNNKDYTHARTDNSAHKKWFLVEAKEVYSEFELGPRFLPGPVTTLTNRLLY